MEFSDLECVQIRCAEDNLEARKEVYLLKSGWDHSCQTPGSYWMWFKEVDGRQYGCSTADAFRIQASADRNAYALARPEEFED
jgi:hypothetical protein